MKNPLPHLREATDAASKIAYLQRDLYVLNAELQAIRQARRVGFGIAGVIFLNIMLTLTLFWGSQALHEAGWSAGILAITSLVLFGLLSGASLLTALRLGGSSP
jgi:hypothetical protein